MIQNKNFLRLIPVGFVLLFLFFFLMLSAGIFKEPTTVSTNAQEAWKCPGNQCNRCGEQGWWGTGCDAFCAANPAGAICQKVDGPLTPCGGFAKICNFSSEDGKTSCISSTLWRCGNDSCYHQIEPAQSCGVPTSVPTLPPGNTFPTAPPSSNQPTTVPTSLPPPGGGSFSSDPVQVSHALFYALQQIPYRLFSQFNQSGISVTPTPGALQPTIPTSPSSGRAQELVAKIRAACTLPAAGEISIQTLGCLYTIIPALRTDTLTLLTESIKPTLPLQCVGFMRGLSNYMGETGEQFCPRVGGAIECAKDNTFYRFVNNYDNVSIRAGDYPIWRCGKYGHIAYVTDVYDTTGSVNRVKIAEANWEGRGVVQERNIDIKKTPITGSCDVIGWLTKRT